MTWWFSPFVSPEDDARRLAALRIVVGVFAFGYVAARLPDLAASAVLPTAQFAPVSVVGVLRAPLPVATVLAIAIATLVLLAAFTAGVRYRVTAPAAALGLLTTLAYRNSWGLVFHTENLLVLHVIALACAPAADAWAITRPRARSQVGYAWAIRLCIALTALTYVLAGIAKLRLCGFAWLDGDQLRNQVAVDNLRKALLGDGLAPLAIPMLDHPAAFRALAAASLLVELGAPVALLRGRLPLIWAAAAWGFHIGVILLMNIWFPYPLLGIAYAPLLPLHRVIKRRRE